MKMPDSNRSEKLSCIGFVTAIVLGLYLSSLHSYLLFHSLVEITTITVGFTLFILTWNARGVLTNNYLSLLGIGYAFIALIDLLHTLAYKGMNVFPGFGANLPTQLWIAARYLQAVTLCAAPLFVERRMDNRAIFGGYAATVSVLVAMVYSGNFPDCYIEGKGLTTFKISSEYVITALLLASSYLLYRKRRYFNDRVFFLMVSSIACTIVSEISFTAYLSVYGFANLVGHYLKLVAFYLIYRALLVTGLREPFDLVFRELRQAQEAIRKAHDTLEEQVRVRTAELRASEEKYRALIECANDAVFIHEIREEGMPGPFIEVNELASRRLGYSREELARLSLMELVDPRYRDRTQKAIERLLKDGHAVFETAQMTKDERSIPVEVSTRVLEIRGKRLLFSLVRDSTERKRAEDALNRLNRELRAVSNCNQALMKAEDEQTLLDEVCRIVCDEAGYRMVWVGYAENDDARTVRPVAWAGVEDGYLEQADITWADTERGRGPTGTAIRTGKTGCIQDFETEPKAAVWRNKALQRGYRSSIALLLKHENATFGALNIYSTEPNAFTPDEIRLLEELAGDLAFGVNVLRARNARREAERRIALLSFALDNVREAAYLTDEKAHFHYVNEESCRFLGYIRDELLTMGVADIDADFPLERWPGHWAELKEVGSLTFETRHRAKDGSTLPVEINANYLEYDGQGYNLALARDITERKHADTKLKGQLHFLQQLLDSIPLPLYYKDTGGFYLGCNAAFETLIGIPRNEIVGRTIYDVAPSERAEIHHEADSALLRNPGLQRYEVSGIYNDGKPHDVIFSKATFVDADNRVAGIVGALIDITSRKKAEDLLRLNAERMEVLLRLNQMTGATLDEIMRFAFEASVKVTRSRLGYLAFMNEDETVMTMQLWSREVMAECRVPGIPAIYPVETTGLWGEAVRQRRPIITNDYAAANPWKKGTPEGHVRLTRHMNLPLIVDGRIVLVAGVGNKGEDYTEADVNQMTLLMEGMWRMIERKRAEEMLRGLNDELTRLNEHLEQRVLERTAELEIKRTELEESQQALVNIVDDLIDKSAELEQANVRLKELDRMKSMFIASMSHELRTPLNSVIGFSRILLEEWIGPLNGEQKENLETVLRSGKHLLSLIDDVIDVSKIEAGKIGTFPEDFDIHDVVSEVVKSFERVVSDKGVELKVQAIHHPMHMDRKRLLQCLLNLVSNAVKFTETGKITVCAEVRDGGDMLEMSVSDTGIGIRAGDLDKLFFPFVRLDSPLTSTVPGAGLGLYLTRKLVKEVLQGDITVKSVAGKGSVFVLTVPINGSRRS
jgi:PAS domain S-box-containing protein